MITVLRTHPICSFDNAITFHSHITVVISRGLRSVGFFLKNLLMFRNDLTLKTQYFSLVRTIIEYTSIIWVPFYTYFLIRLERIQNRFLRFPTRQLNICLIIYTSATRTSVDQNSISLESSRFYFFLILWYQEDHYVTSLFSI